MAVRAHRCPGIRFDIKGATSQPIKRAKSLLTGASSAGLLAIIPTEDAILACLERWRSKNMGLAVSSSRLFSMVWSDNIFTAANTVKDAIAMLEDLEQALASKHNLGLKATGREVIHSSCAECAEEALTTRSGNVYQLKPTMRVFAPCSQRQAHRIQT